VFPTWVVQSLFNRDFPMLTAGHDSAFLKCVVSHAMWRNSSQIIWRKQGSFDPRQEILNVQT
jgi:hypothetical protein